jgi:hypothetical protein
MAYQPYAGYPSGTNTYVPNFAASQSLVVGYSRQPNTFQLPRYTQYVMAKNNTGWYFVWTSRQAARILTSDDREHVWSDGDAAPTGINNVDSGQWYLFGTTRRAYPFMLGQMAVEQAEYPLIAAVAGDAAQQCMTARTLLTYNALSGASWGSNTAAVNGTILGAGQGWNTGQDGLGTNPGPNIKKSFQYADKIINLQTIGVVQPRDTTVVVNPTTAMAMAASGEIQDYIKQSPFALAQLRGDVPNQNGRWNLPDTLYGHPIAVEDAVRVSTNKGASSTTIGYVVPDGEAYMLARQGELEGLQGTRSYSTVQIFFYQDEMTVETMYDANNRRYSGRVVSNFSPVVVSTISGFKFTSCLV